MARDKVLHFAACAIVAVVGALIAKAMGAPAVAGIAAATYAGLAAGLGKEYGDRCALGNHWDWLDVAADMAGALAASMLWLV